MKIADIKALHAAFTLIELLIVVAIIAILAAIAVPNFLEAQTRAKVSRSKADLRTIATGLEVYKLDTNKLPHTNYDNRSLNWKKGGGFEPTLERLTTPISYLTGDASFMDPFKGQFYRRDPNYATKTPLTATGNDRTNKSYWYTGRNAAMQTWNGKTTPTWWFLESCGPDGHYHLSNEHINSLKDGTQATLGRAAMAFYEATNGTTSQGSVWRSGGAQQGPGAAFYKLAQSNL